MKLKPCLSGGCLTILMLFGAGYWSVNRAMQAFSMHNQVHQETKSPDGKYVATLAYSDGLTYGYFFVSLQPSGGWHSLGSDDPIPKDEVVEVAAEGLDNITWQGNHTLIVKYVKSGDDAAVFEVKQKSWKDVHIVYRAN